MDRSRKKIYLATGINESFLPRGIAYIETIHHKCNVTNIVMTLDFSIPEKYRQEFDSVRFIEISSSEIRSPNPNACMQHGAFLSALDFVDNRDIVVYTDADIRMQRGFNSAELDMLLSFGNGDIGVGYNETDTDSLLQEAVRLKPNISIQEIKARFPGIDELLTYNTGVLVANCGTYKRLYDLYNESWKDFEPIFTLNAKQQWLLSYLINKHFTPRIIPDIIHTHGKYPVELRVKGEAGYRFCIGSELVVFNHAIQHKSEYLASRLSKQLRRQRRRVKRMSVALISLAIVCIVLLIKSLL